MQCEDGQNLVEYGLIVCPVSMAAVAVLRSVAAPVNSLLANVSSVLNGALRPRATDADVDARPAAD